jgi:hypothetical protein
MKIFASILTIFSIFGCGILSAIFGNPDYYINRTVEPKEIIGSWKITPNSEAEILSFRRSIKDWGIDVPWKAIVFRDNNYCDVKLEISWLNEDNNLPTEFPHNIYSKDELANNISSCVWEITRTENIDQKEVPIINITLSYLDTSNQIYILYIHEKDSKLILWNVIGDWDDFQTEEFLREG